MDINLKGKAPKASTLEEANEIIKALWAVIQKLSINRDIFTKKCYDLRHEKSTKNARQQQ